MGGKSRPEKAREHSRAYAKRHPRRVAGHKMRQRYGITLAEYDLMVVTQCGTCSICGNVPSEDPDAYRKTLLIDHDHTTGVVRGLICQPCNTGLGNFKDSITLMGNAIAYLKGQ